MYNAVMSFTVVVAVYFGIKALAGSFLNWKIFDTKASLCVVVGSFIGLFVNMAFSQMSTKAGWFGMGLSLALVFLLAYTRAIETILHKIPKSIRNVVRTVFKIAKFALGAIAIISVVYIALSVLM